MKLIINGNKYPEGTAHGFLVSQNQGLGIKAYVEKTS